MTKSKDKVMHSGNEIIQPSTRSRFPRSNTYDIEWVLANRMGPNALWLMESLAEQLPLQPGMRVLDLGCGRATTSIFLAREFGVQVVAADLWVDPSENWTRVKQADLGTHILPVRVEAHDLPFASGSFDAIVSVDAFHYFGTDDLYLDTILELIEPGGRIGIVVPACTEEAETVLEHLKKAWWPDYRSFHGPAWWRRHWERAEVVEVERCDLIEEGWSDWLHWIQVCKASGIPAPDGEFVDSGDDLLEADQGRTIGFTRMIARRLDQPPAWR